MPYKNPEDKRRWEKENREKRSTQRRARSRAIEAPIPPQAISSQSTHLNWKALIGVAMFALVGMSAANRLGGFLIEGTKGPNP